MKDFAYLIRYGVVGSILWQERGLYKISFFHENNNKVEIFIPSEIKLRNTDGYEEMTPSELKRFVKDGKLKEKDIENFYSYISNFDRSDIYIIIENLKKVDSKLFDILKNKLNGI